MSRNSRAGNRAERIVRRVTDDLQPPGQRKNGKISSGVVGPGLICHTTVLICVTGDLPRGQAHPCQLFGV